MLQTNIFSLANSVFISSGFTTAKDVNADVINTATGGKSKSDITWTDTASVDGKSDQPSSHFEQVLEARSSYARSDDGSPRSPRGRSPPESLLSERVLDSPTREHVNKDINSHASPRNTEIFRLLSAKFFGNFYIFEVGFHLYHAYLKKKPHDNEVGNYL